MQAKFIGVDNRSGAGCTMLRSGVRALMAATIVVVGLVAAGSARADTLFIEAEGAGHNGKPLSESETRITSPLLIKDDGAASLGRYLQVAAGFNSPTSPPAVEGVARYRFGVSAAGNYRIWGRVIAPTINNDSFWVRVKNLNTGALSTLVRWNDIDAGSSWHWAQVVNDNVPGPAQFALLANTPYELQISYREEGAKLDMMVITNDTSFNPKTPPATAPAVPPDAFDAPYAIPRKLSAGAKTGIKVFWSEVPGAVSYTLARSTSDGQTTLPTLTGLTGHSFTETTLPTNGGSNCYQLTAIFADGSFRTSPAPYDTSICEHLQYEQTFLDVGSILSGAAPMVVDEENNSAYTAAGTASSSSAPPAHGRLRFDFAVGAAAQLRLWFDVNVPDDAHDSFWARMDEGTWVKWNNIPNGCSQVSNSDAGGAPVTFSVAAGTHRFELAYRETGTVSTFQAPTLSSIFFITDDLQATSSICDD
jgi:hypothetical protein